MTHPDIDLLAEFRAGLIAGRRGRRIGAHVAGCDRCAALGDRLAGVSALLAGVPPPVMPPSVAQRLDAVLAAEAGRKADPERAGGDGPPDRWTAARPVRRRGFRLVRVRLLAPAAAVELAVAGYGLSQIGRGPSLAPPPAPRAALMRPALYLSVVTTGTDYQRATIRRQLEADLRSTTPAPSGQPASLQLLGRHVCGGADMSWVSGDGGLASTAGQAQVQQDGPGPVPVAEQCRVVRPGRRASTGTGHVRVTGRLKLWPARATQKVHTCPGRSWPGSRGGSTRRAG